MRILVLNSGSSSQKMHLYEIGDSLPEHPPAPLWAGKVEWDADRAVIEVREAAGEILTEAVPTASRAEAAARLLDALMKANSHPVATAGGPALTAAIDAVGHRIVTAGPEYEQPAIITAEVKTAIARTAAFAPLHNRVELEGIEIVERRLGPISQIAVFDTGFHSRLPEAAFTYPGPYEWLSQGIRRFGFHGINHRYCAERAAQLLGRDLRSLRLVSCHLGNGCSLAAINDGRSIDTTMGFTPLEGLMMGTRSGSVDPGILTYLMRRPGHTPEQMDQTLNERSGLLGISGLSSDMRQIVAAMNDGNARAKLAFDMFVHRLRAGIGAMAAALSGIDGLIFTAGIGENSSDVRAAACANLGFLGVRLDPSKNDLPALDQDVAAPGSAVPVLVIRAQEDWAIACECRRLAGTAPRA